MILAAPVFPCSYQRLPEEELSRELVNEELVSVSKNLIANQVVRRAGVSVCRLKVTES